MRFHRSAILSRGGKSNPELQNNMVIQSVHNTNGVATKSLRGHYPVMPKMSAVWKFVIRCHPSPSLIYFQPKLTINSMTRRWKRGKRKEGGKGKKVERKKGGCFFFLLRLLRASPIDHQLLANSWMWQILRPVESGPYALFLKSLFIQNMSGFGIQFSKWVGARGQGLRSALSTV